MAPEPFKSFVTPLGEMSRLSEDTSKLIARCRVRRNVRLPLGAGLDLGRVLACILLLEGCSDLQRRKVHMSCDTLQQPFQKASDLSSDQLTYPCPICSATKQQSIYVRVQADKGRARKELGKMGGTPYLVTRRQGSHTGLHPQSFQQRSLWAAGTLWDPLPPVTCCPVLLRLSCQPRQ